MLLKMARGVWEKNGVCSPLVLARFLSLLWLRYSNGIGQLNEWRKDRIFESNFEKIFSVTPMNNSVTQIFFFNDNIAVSKFL